MSCVVQQDDLSKALNTLQAFIGKKSPLVIMSYFLVRIDNGQIEVSGTDLEVSVSMQVPAEVKQSATFSVPGKMFADVVRQLPTGLMNLSLSDAKKLEIKSNTTKYKLNVLGALEFPKIPGLDLVTDRKIDCRIFAEMINRTIYAASHDEAKFNLSGICFEPTSDGRVTMVATDGHRFALSTRDIPNLRLGHRVLFPKRGLSELRRVFDDGHLKEVEVGFGGGFVVFKSDSSKFALRLMDVDYPDYARAFPNSSGVKIEILVQEFSDALRRVSLILASQGQGVRVDIAEDSMRISSRSPELGESEERLVIVGTDEPISVGFNARFLIDVVSSFLISEKIVIEILNGNEPARFYPCDDEHSIAMVMPIRIE